MYRYLMEIQSIKKRDITNKLIMFLKMQCLVGIGIGTINKIFSCQKLMIANLLN
jgi:hypothetical protein